MPERMLESGSLTLQGARWREFKAALGSDKAADRQCAEEAALYQTTPGSTICLRDRVADTRDAMRAREAPANNGLGRQSPENVETGSRARVRGRISLPSAVDIECSQSGLRGPYAPARENIVIWRTVLAQKFKHCRRERTRCSVRSSACPFSTLRRRRSKPLPSISFHFAPMVFHWFGPPSKS